MSKRQAYHVNYYVEEIRRGNTRNGPVPCQVKHPAFELVCKLRSTPIRSRTTVFAPTSSHSPAQITTWHDYLMFVLVYFSRLGLNQISSLHIETVKSSALEEILVASNSTISEPVPSAIVFTFIQ